MPQYPDLVQNYVEYAQIKAEYAKSGKVDLRRIVFIYPTTLLPLIPLILNNPSCYVEPARTAPREYVSTLLHPPPQGLGKSHVALAPLPQNRAESEKVLEAVYAMCDRPNHDSSAKSVFAYAISELVANIYDHSKYSRALVLAQAYDHKRFLDLSFFDNGVTIPGSFGTDAPGSPGELIRMALNGKSIKGTSRGFGLRTAFKLFTDGCGADFFVASDGGAVYGGSEVEAYGETNRPLQYKLHRSSKIDGTLITVRIPFDLPPVNIYKYVE